MSAAKKVDPRLEPFIDALAEMLVADHERKTAAKATPAPARSRDATSKANGAMGLASWAIDRLKSGDELARADRLRIARVIRGLTRRYFDATTAERTKRRRGEHSRPFEMWAAALVARDLLRRRGVRVGEAIAAAAPDADRKRREAIRKVLDELRSGRSPLMTALRPSAADVAAAARRLPHRLV